MHQDFSASSDARQTNEWGVFLSRIGWQVTTLDGIFIFIRYIPYLKRSIIKIQHPKGPIPFNRIEILAHKKRALFTVIEPHFVGYDNNEFRKNAYAPSKLRYAHSATILLDLRQSEDQLWRSFSENTRRNIRKAERLIEVKRIALRSERSEKLLKEFYQLYRKLGEEKNFYVPSYHEVSAKIHAFREHSYFLYAFEKGKKTPAAILWVGAAGNTLIYFHPANTEAAYRSNANYLLVWEALKLGKKLKVSFFDFETAYDSRYGKENERWRGYTEFKKKFGGEYVEFPPSYIKFYNPLMKHLYYIATAFSK